ncbi:putative methyltransferase [Drosera capensis]
MDVEKSFRMREGHGGSSYSKNSSLQKKVSDKVKHIAIEAIQRLYLETKPKSLAIADLGCSSGPNTLSIIGELYQAVVDVARGTVGTTQALEFVVYLNDLPSNDFNSIFEALPQFYSDLDHQGRKDNVAGDEREDRFPIYVAAFPGSFYGRIFPNKSLHFVYSSFGVHWLSKVPPGIYDENGESMNKGSIYISAGSPQQVRHAYSEQFRGDFSSFLRLRSQELTTGGRMALILLGRESSDDFDRGNSKLWELLTQSFTILIKEGKVEKEKLDSYDVHFYAPYRDEVEEVVSKEGSFKLDQLTMIQSGTTKHSSGMVIAMTIRAIQESMIEDHFGEGILDPLFSTYAKLIDNELLKGEIVATTLALVLINLC